MQKKYIFVFILVILAIAIIYYVCSGQGFVADGQKEENNKNIQKKELIMCLEGSMPFDIERDFYSLHGFYPKKMPPFLIFNERYSINEESNKMVDNKTGSTVGIRFATTNSFLLEGYDTIRKSQCFAGTVGKKYVANRFFIHPNDYSSTMPDSFSPIEIKRFDFKDHEKKLKLEANQNKNMDVDKVIFEFRKEKINIFKDAVMQGIKNNDEYIGFVIDIWAYADENTIEPYDVFLEQKQHPLVKVRILWAYIILECKNKLPLIERQMKEENSDIVKVKMIEAVSKLGGKITHEQKKYVNSRLEKGSWHEKILAIEALASFGVESFDTIVKCLQDKDPDVRTAAMLALMKMAPDKAIQPLYETYKSEKEIDLKYNAWYCLSQCVDPKRKVISLKEFNDNEKKITVTLKKTISDNNGTE